MKTKKKINLLIVILLAAVLLSFGACSSYNYTGRALYVNGEQTCIQDYDSGKKLFPFSKLLFAAGGNFADSVYSAYGVSVISLDGKSYVFNYENHLFVYENDYADIIEESKAEGKRPRYCEGFVNNLLPAQYIADGVIWEAAEVYVSSDVLTEVFSKMGYSFDVEYVGTDDEFVYMTIKRNEE